MFTRVEKKIADRIFSLETGVLAKQADGAVVARYGETIVLATVVAVDDWRNVPFFPLSVEYREKQYSAGQFPGGIFKREGRPTTKEVLTCRLIDRPMRPLFPKGYHQEVQVHIWVLCFDGENDPDVPAMTAASAALAISGIPWNGPTAASRVALVNDEFVVNPTHDQRAESELDLVVSSTGSAIAMVEGEADILPEEDILVAIECAHDINVELVKLVDELVEKVGKPTRQWEAQVSADSALAALGEDYYRRFVEAHHTAGQQNRRAAIGALRAEAVEAFCGGDDQGEDGNALTPPEIDAAFDAFEDRAMRTEIVNDGRRGDGRALDQIRDLSCQVAYLPRTHGSAVFSRGETQVLAVTTLGSVSDELRVLDPLVETPNKKFMLHYNFPPFSVGEVKPARGPSRRDQGHGNLAERALLPVLPSRDDFPYTIRIVADVLESNGSSSQASICAGTLALMDAGVPITDPVAGIAMGLIKHDGQVFVLTDIAGAEDHHGDMDFKIAGTQNGITAVQMDLKVEGIDMEILGRALEQARVARMEILRTMLETLPQPRESISPYAPRLIMVRIPPDLIGKLIGPGGKNIKALQETYGVNIDVEDDDTVTISGTNVEGAEEAAHRIGLMGKRPEVGVTYDGVITEVKDFGAIVEVFPGADGLCHVSQLSDKYVENVRDVCKVGDTLRVKVLNVEDNRVRLSHKAVLQDEKKNS